MKTQNRGIADHINAVLKELLRALSSNQAPPTSLKEDPPAAEVPQLPSEDIALKRHLTPTEKDHVWAVAVHTADRSRMRELTAEAVDGQALRTFLSALARAGDGPVTEAVRDLSARLPGCADIALDGVERCLLADDLRGAMVRIQGLLVLIDRPILSPREFAGLAVRIAQAVESTLPADRELVDAAGKVLSAFAVRLVRPRLGEDFDPNNHQREGFEPGSGYDNRQVARVIQPGYLQGRVVLERARVMVGG